MELEDRAKIEAYMRDNLLKIWKEVLEYTLRGMEITILEILIAVSIMDKALFMIKMQIS